jgi:hypothetical protein
LPLILRNNPSYTSDNDLDNDLLNLNSRFSSSLKSRDGRTIKSGRSILIILESSSFNSPLRSGGDSFIKGYSCINSRGNSIINSSSHLDLNPSNNNDNVFNVNGFNI